MFNVALSVVWELPSLETQSLLDRSVWSWRMLWVVITPGFAYHVQLPRALDGWTWWERENWPTIRHITLNVIPLILQIDFTLALGPCHVPSQVLLGRMWLYLALMKAMTLTYIKSTMITTICFVCWLDPICFREMYSIIWDSRLQWWRFGHWRWPGGRADARDGDWGALA